MKKIVVLTGAGMSAESGIKTFRDAGGLWEDHDVMEVASIDGWYKDPLLVLEFYNQRRKQLAEVHPNKGHKALVELEKHFDVYIITQNVDDLHERAGSKNILHLHGELTKVRSTGNEDMIYDIGAGELKWGEKCEKGYQLRPHIVWFGEPVPMIMEAAKITEQADILIIIGTSLNVYPAAGLLDYASYRIPKYLIDPNASDDGRINNVTIIRQEAGTGVPALVKELESKFATV
ncbi:MAG: NAD-dependent deacylase [Bacteroidetes bacterium]|nr:NAD-dependent deacylase [Bacteroidota bacterium]MBU1717756.1 NAD-dependent deacylase [Bacteroidota bacterium]